MHELQKLVGKPQVGTATITAGAELVADFCLQGEETYVNLHNAPGALVFGPELQVLPVRMTDGTHVTFLDCIVKSSTNFTQTNARLLSLLPSYALIGAESVRADDKFESVSFTTDDIDRIFYDSDAFSIALGADDQLKEIIAAHSDKIGRPIEVGEHPIGAFFTGKFDIVVTDTLFGKVSARHRPSFGMGGPNGVALENEIRIHLDLTKPKGARAIVGEVARLLRFLQVMAGRTQNVANISVRPHGSEETSSLDLLWVLADRREHEGRKPHAADVPINGGKDPHEFSKVLAGWLSADVARLDARLRFNGCFAQQNIFGIERLVSAANLFDLLPPTCFTKPGPLAADATKARAAARQLFKALPPSDVRDRALGGLGRLDRLNLKSKVLQRAEKLLAAAPGKFAHLEPVLRHAVDARNHYVHGTTVKPDKLQFYYDKLSFHVEALEFVFATTDLIDAGWNYAAWASRGSSLSHPLGDFRVSYDRRITRYMDRLSQIS